MKAFKLKLWGVLLFIGLVAVLSLMLSDLNLEDLPIEIRDKIPMEVLRWLVLLNPTFLVIILSGVGVLLYDRAGFKLPVFESLLNKPEHEALNWKSIMTWGAILGTVSGILIMIVSAVFEPFLPQAMLEANDKLELHILTKVLYGGLAEELMLRFGLMSLMAFILFKISKRLNSSVYWLANILSSMLFALGHLPAVYQLLGTPTTAVYLYILFGNFMAGLIFGYAYWKKGLESAMISHALAHVTITSLSFLIMN